MIYNQFEEVAEM